MTIPAPLLQTMRLGRWTTHLIQAGGMQLDGGAMFGVVPKTLWSRKITPDDKNRIPMCMRVLLIEHESGLILVDTGSGSKDDAKFQGLYGIDNTVEGGITSLEAGLRAAGHAPDDVTLVINTHLHFDHAGGNTVRDAAGAIAPAFPNARYVVQAGEFHYVTHTNERTAGSYFDANYVPLVERGRYDLIEGDREIIAGIRSRVTPGHTPHHQSIVLEGDVPACFVADVMPTAHHMPLPWIMGYDVEPLRTLEAKRALLTVADADGWMVVFEHDPVTASGRVTRDGKGFALAS